MSTYLHPKPLVNAIWWVEVQKSVLNFSWFVLYSMMSRMSRDFENFHFLFKFWLSVCLFVCWNAWCTFYVIGYIHIIHVICKQNKLIIIFSSLSPSISCHHLLFIITINILSSSSLHHHHQYLVIIFSPSSPSISCHHLLFIVTINILSLSSLHHHHQYIVIIFSSSSSSSSKYVNVYQ